MKMNFTMFFLFFVFYVSFLQFADCQFQTCGPKNKIGNCTTLDCSSCLKRPCTQEIKKGHDTATLSAAITVPIIVVLLLVATVFATKKWVQSSQRNNRDSLKSENPSVTNPYAPGPPKTFPPGPPKTMHPFSPADDNEYESIYTYEYWDTENLRGKDNPMEVIAEGQVSTGDDYEIPNPPLGKPNFPPPHVPDSPT